MAEDLQQSQLKPDADANAPPRVRMTELGYLGLKTIQRQVIEEANIKLRMPFLIREIDEMKKDSSIASALQFYKMMLGRVKWTVKPPLNATPQQVERAKFIKSCMDDMDHSWFSFIMSLLSCVDYGFSINEKVYKYRRKGNSKYDDGLVGWKCFPSRAQSSLYGWLFSDDGRQLLGMRQSLKNLIQSQQFTNLISANGAWIDIPRNKFLLFRTSPLNDNPEGTAALKSAWVAWRYKKAIEEQEMVGIGRDLGGLLNIGIPARYMSPDASDAEKAIYENYKKVVRNVAVGEQSGIIVPSDVDSDTKSKLFSVDLLTSNGSRGYDTNAIIQRYTNQMLIALFADLLQLGNNSTGSFALAGSKQDVIQYALEYRLKEIRDVLNYDLIPQTYALNQWSDTDYCTFEFEDLAAPDLETLSKFLQRTAATGSIEIDRELLNYSRSLIGLDPKPDDEPINPPTPTSRSGDGMASATGGLNGTGNSVGGDNSSMNMDNKE